VGEKGEKKETKNKVGQRPFFNPVVFSVFQLGADPTRDKKREKCRYKKQHPNLNGFLRSALKGKNIECDTHRDEDGALL